MSDSTDGTIFSVEQVPAVTPLSNMLKLNLRVVSVRIPRPLATVPILELLLPGFYIVLCLLGRDNIERRCVRGEVYENYRSGILNDCWLAVCLPGATLAPGQDLHDFAIDCEPGSWC